MGGAAADREIANLDDLDPLGQERPSHPEAIAEAVGFEPQRRDEELRDGACGPGLRVARDGVTHRDAELFLAEPREAFREPVVREVLGGVEQPEEEALGCLIQPVSPKAAGDEAVVMRPHRSKVVADRVVGHGR